MIKIPKPGGQLFGEDRAILNGAGNIYSWNLTIPPNSVINTPNSYIKYKVRFSMAGLDEKSHGRYFVKDSYVWF